MLSLNLASLRFALFPFSLSSWLIWTGSWVITPLWFVPLNPCCPFPLIWILSVPGELCKAPAHHESLIICFPMCNTSCPPCPRVLSCCLLSFNFIPSTQLSCSTQMKKKKMKLLGKMKSLMKYPAYANFPVIVFILYKFSYIFAKYIGWFHVQVNLFSMVTSRDYSCDMPQMDQGFEIKFLTGKRGICNAKNRTHQIENFIDRVKAQRYRNSSTYTLLSCWEKPGSVCPIQGNNAGPGAEQRPSLLPFACISSSMSFPMANYSSSWKMLH